MIVDYLDEYLRQLLITFTEVRRICRYWGK